MKKTLKKYYAAVLAAAMLITQVLPAAAPVSAETLGEMFSSQKQPVVFDYEDKADYLTTSERYRQAGYHSPDDIQRINVEVDKLTITGASPKYQNFGGMNTVLWDESIKSIDCTVLIEKEGL